MRRSIFALLCIALIAIGGGVFAEDYYGFSSNKPNAETTQVPSATPYTMPAVPLTATISSASPLLLRTAVGSNEPQFCVLEASDNVYLNGTIATPSLGILVTKNTPELIPIGEGVTVITSSNSVSLKILPVK